MKINLTENFPEVGQVQVSLDGRIMSLIFEALGSSLAADADADTSTNTNTNTNTDTDSDTNADVDADADAPAAAAGVLAFGGIDLVHLD